MAGLGGIVRTDGDGVPRALLLTAASAVLPGVAHLAAGHRRTGITLMSVWAALLAAGGIALYTGRDELLDIAVRPDLLTEVMVAALVAGAVWAALVVASYRAVRPRDLGPVTRALTWTVVAGICAAAVTPPLAVARYSYVEHDLISNVFANTPAQAAGTGTHSAGTLAVPPQGAALPARLNILLIGGDADVNRPGIRTDSMTMASINTRSGATTLVSLPRNLQHVPVWDGHRRVPFPATGLLNAVYQLGSEHPKLTGGPHPGIELLKRTFGHIIGQPVNYYAMVDMRSFRQIVDALHGVRICVSTAVPVPRQQVPAGVIRPGCQHLDGRQALWYGRSRTGSSDYARMSRQKCLMWALAHQADPMTVLRNFQRLAQIFKYSVNTDIPQRLLPALVHLQQKIDTTDLTALQFIPPTINTWTPNYARIRTLTAQALTNPTKTPAIHHLSQTCT